MIFGSWSKVVQKPTVLLTPYRDTHHGVRIAAGMYMHAVMLPSQLTRSKVVLYVSEAVGGRECRRINCEV